MNWVTQAASFFHGLLLTSVQCWTFKDGKNELQKGNRYVVCFEWKPSSSLILKDLSSRLFLRKETVKKGTTVNIEHRTLFIVLGNPIPSSLDPTRWLFHLVYHVRFRLSLQMYVATCYLAMLPSQATNTQRKWQWMAWPSKFSELLLTVASLRESKLVQTMTWFGMRNLSNRFQWQVKIYRTPLQKCNNPGVDYSGRATHCMITANHYKGL